MATGVTVAGQGWVGERSSEFIVPSSELRGVGSCSGAAAGADGCLSPRRSRERGGAQRGVGYSVFGVRYSDSLFGTRHSVWLSGVGGWVGVARRVGAARSV